MASMHHAAALFMALGLTSALPQPRQANATQPQVASATEIGYLNDLTLNRDSCTSAMVGDREFWTCRDTTNFDGQSFFIFGSTASWTNFNSDGTPAIVNGNLTTYGDNSGTYYATASDECPPNGFCGNGSERWPLWPNTAPLPVSNGDGSYKIYEWIQNVHLDSSGNQDNGPFPPTSLYRSDFDGTDGTDLPPVTLVNENFWPANSIPFGNYGWVMGTDGFVYLYGIGANNGAVLARVDPQKIEDVTAYSYYSNSNGWSSTAPSTTDTGAPIPNAGTGQQGTFYYSSYFESYIWIGGAMGDDAQFVISTAPAPEGPWTKPYIFYTGTPGSSFNGYSWQAHPGLSADQGNGKDIYLTFTRVNHYYENVLIYIQWQ